jgi:predicted GNAT family acetyltransferase
MTTTIEVRNNTAASRYEITIEGHLAESVYTLHGNVISFTHTKVPAELEGRGIASQMAKFALDNAQAKGYQVKPVCPFVKGYIEKHPEYQALL